MKKINPQEVINQVKQNSSQTNLTKSQERTLKKTDLPIHWTAELFKKFQARYGHKWVSAMDGIEKVAVKEWSEQLAGITGEQIAFGLDNWNEDWPPSSVEFKKCCLDKLGKDEESTRQTNTFIALPPAVRLEENKDMVNEARNEIKKKLGIS